MIDLKEFNRFIDYLLGKSNPGSIKRNVKRVTGFQEHYEKNPKDFLPGDFVILIRSLGNDIDTEYLHQVNSDIEKMILKIELRQSNHRLVNSYWGV